MKTNFKILARFLGGAALGTFAIIVPVSYGTSLNFTGFQVGLIAAGAIACGLLVSLWGEKFVNALMQTLDSTGL